MCLIIICAMPRRRFNRVSAPIRSALLCGPKDALKLVPRVSAPRRHSGRTGNILLDQTDVVAGQHNAVLNRATKLVAGSHRMRFAIIHEPVQEVCPIRLGRCSVFDAQWELSRLGEHCEVRT